MMAPAFTRVPSNTFTPSRWALESRPLRVDPPPLVFDIGGSSALGDRGDLDGRVLLPVPVAPPLVGPPLVGEPVDLGTLGGTHHPPGHRRPGQLGRGSQH